MWGSFPNFNYAVVDVWKWVSHFIPHFTGHVITHPCWDLNHCGRMTHICISKLIIIGSDNGLSPNRRQAIVRTKAGLLLIDNTFQCNWNWNSNVFIHENVFENVVWKVAAIWSRPQCVELNHARKRDPLWLFLKCDLGWRLLNSFR